MRPLMSTYCAFMMGHGLSWKCGTNRLLLSRCMLARAFLFFLSLPGQYAVFISRADLAILEHTQATVRPRR